MEITIKKWNELGEKLFKTKDKREWLFKCPSCSVSIKGREWTDARVPDMFAFSCIGRAENNKAEFLNNKSGKKPCNYAGGGLFRLNPVDVVFDDEVTLGAFAFDHPDFGLEKEKEC